MKKRILFLFIFVGFSAVLFSQETHDGWQNDYDEAVKIAKNEKKPILIFFTGSDWCGPCKMLMSDFFQSSKFKSIAAENFVLYEADFPKNTDLLTPQKRKKNYYLGGLYDVKSYPTIVIIDSDGTQLGRRKGYNLMRDSSYHFKLIEQTLSKI
ncbi:thioredoxin family protein [Urechidicola croceus]|uniref:Thioredoxin domain-containing protein n=1 Tax=Urechidicola croceus TaxID=1850246 RepID=A0A1D8P6S3_9FLAO|nr:thioredoxin family protein [Urechidicola croceus]AOW20275.1 hypothetical protein LPB138_06105 [Urechidicola croceus]